LPIITLNGISSLAAVRETRHIAKLQSKGKLLKQQILPGKGPNENFEVRKCYLERNL